MFEDKLEGTVKWFSASRGYGFVEKEDGEDIFVHFSGIIADGFKTLNEGDRVSFVIEESDKGPQAVSVEVIE